MRLLSQIEEPTSVRFVDTCDPEAVHSALSAAGGGLVIAESPTNPSLRVADLRLLAEATHSAGKLTFCLLLLL